MILTEYVETFWNSKTKKYYEEKGYTYTKMGYPFLVSVWDLKPYSQAKIKLGCDYCGREYETTWSIYYHTKDNVKKDCCSDPKCTGAKAEEAMMAKHGVKSCRHIEGIDEKIKQTCLEKYGAENPFASEEIKEKIYQINMEKYGVKIPTQNPEIQKKCRDTCLEKYGHTSYAALYSKTHIGKLSPTWKSDTKYQRDERHNYEYIEWRRNVFIRDKYTCQNCGAHNQKGNNKTVRLVAHHIKNWKDNPEDRYDEDNGVTLCEPCHIQFHSMYGKKNNTKEQFDDFLNLTKDKEIC